jgi:hypothetical protein
VLLWEHPRQSGGLGTVAKRATHGGVVNQRGSRAVPKGDVTARPALRNAISKAEANGERPLCLLASSIPLVRSVHALGLVILSKPFCEACDTIFDLGRWHETDLACRVLDVSISCGHVARLHRQHLLDRGAPNSFSSKATTCRGSSGRLLAIL